MTRPNILIFMTDQQRGDTVLPQSKAIMPNIDRFRKESVTFSNAFCPSPHCCPSRATFFTGLYPSQHGVWNNVEVANTLSSGLYEGTPIFSDDLREQGYTLYYSGKWHVSIHELPPDRGWEMNFPSQKSVPFDRKAKNHREDWEWNRYKQMTGEKDPESRKTYEIVRPGYDTFTICGINESPFNDRQVVDDALGFLRTRAKDETPWCQFVGTLGPHDTYHVPQKFLDMYADIEIELPDNFEDPMTDKPSLYRRTKDRFKQLTHQEHREAIRHYLAFCSYEDALFGEILEALENSGQAENTIVLFVSDHGDYMGEHGIWTKGLPCFRSAYHVPAIIRWPQGVVNPGRSVDEFVSLADFAPTFLEMADVKTEMSFTGQSLVPFLQNRRPENWRDTIYTQSNGNELYGIQRSVMTREWKYVYNGFDYDELYNLKEDPGEVHNLATDPKYDSVIKDMCRRMWQFAYDCNDTCVNSYIMISFAPYGPGVIFQ